MWPMGTSFGARAPKTLIHMRRDTYYLDRPYFSDFIFEDWTLREWVRASANVDELAAPKGLGEVGGERAEVAFARAAVAGARRRRRSICGQRNCASISACSQTG